MMVASIVILRARITFVNISSQMVAGVGVHSARANAKRAKWRRDHTAKRHRDMHLFPAPLQSSRMLQSRHFQP